MGDDGSRITFIPPEILRYILRFATSVPDPLEIPSSYDLVRDPDFLSPAAKVIQKRYANALVGPSCICRCWISDLIYSSRRNMQ